MITTRIELADTWAYGAADLLPGDWLMDTLAGAALGHTAHPHPVAVSAHVGSAPRTGAGEVTVVALLTCRTLPGPHREAS